MHFSIAQYITYIPMGSFRKVLAFTFPFPGLLIKMMKQCIFIEQCILGNWPLPTGLSGNPFSCTVVILNVLCERLRKRFYSSPALFVCFPAVLNQCLASHEQQEDTAKFK